MRTKARVDGNHAEVVSALRKIGCSVQDLSRVGRGCPDLLVGWRGINVAMEVKDGSKPPSERKLTKSQKAWHVDWEGLCCVVNSPTEAIQYMQEVTS